MLVSAKESQKGQIIAKNKEAEYYKKINKSFDVLGAVYKELTLSYLLDVDPEELMKSAIDGMVKRLDPYTVYYAYEDNDKIDYLNEESYVGFGITVFRVDSTIYIRSIKKGYGAEEAGLKIGDIIHSIDGVVVENFPIDSLRDFTRGEENTIARVRVLRGNLPKDTISLNVERLDVEGSAISHVTMLSDDVAYVAIDRFSRGMANRVGSLLRELKKEYQEFNPNSNSLLNIIIDLRGNPGGLLSEAVELSELFLPKGSEIVSTVGKNDVVIANYDVTRDPEFPDSKIAVLLDGYSASASEVFAGAIQDNDRGIVLGEESFGKGLVQNYARLPFGAKLKLTTANYFTPSGRSIQRVNFQNSIFSDEQTEAWSAAESDTNKFKSLSGRPLTVHTGIRPDSSVNSFDYDEKLQQVLNPSFAFEFFATQSVYDSTFALNQSLSENTWNKFLEFINEERLYPYSSDFRRIAEVQSELEDWGENSEAFQQSERLKEAYISSLRSLLNDNQKTAKLFLKFEALRHNLKADEYTGFVLSKDNIVTTAMSLFRDSGYSDILKPITEVSIPDNPSEFDKQH
ncbi:MAG: S41 family peptidase [Candidatus Kapaibacteriales bacterium]